MKLLFIAEVGLAVTVADFLSAPSTASTLTVGGLPAAFSSRWSAFAPLRVLHSVKLMFDLKN